MPGFFGDDPIVNSLAAMQAQAQAQVHARAQAHARAVVSTAVQDPEDVLPPVRLPAKSHDIVVEQDDRQDQLVLRFVVHGQIRELRINRNVFMELHGAPTHARIEAVVQNERDRLTRPTFSILDMEAQTFASKVEVENLRMRFKSLFSVPADAVEPMEVATEAGQIRIRVRVREFTVETTMGLLAAAKANRGAALTWDRQIRGYKERFGSSISAGVDAIQHAIQTRVLDAGEVSVIDSSISGSGSSSPSTPSE